MEDLRRYITTPKVKSATELVKHKHGPGLRYVFMNKEMVEDSDVYTIIRAVKGLVETADYVDEHSHECSSEFVFIGDNDDLTGLRARITLNGQEFFLDSPKGVFIPAGMMHSVKLISGSGKFINIVLHPEYNNVTK